MICFIIFFSKMHGQTCSVMPRNLCITIKYCFPLPQEFFYNLSLAVRKKMSCCKKKNLAARKRIFLSLYQENIFLTSEIISVEISQHSESLIRIQAIL